MARAVAGAVVGSHAAVGSAPRRGTGGGSQSMIAMIAMM
jgi:gas vesicle protein